MRRAPWAFAILLAGCAASPPPLPAPAPAPMRAPFPARASQTERTAAEAAYMTCLKVAAYQMDDGISDARTIAAALRPSCVPEWQAVYESQVRGETPSVVEATYRDRDDWQSQDTLEAVLTMRRLRPKR